MYSDNSSFYREVYDWFLVVMEYYVSSGMQRREARASAYDSVELRFNIGYSRARTIVRQVGRSGMRMTKAERGAAYQNNLQIIKLINIVNGEYSGHRVPVEGECAEK